MFELKDYDDFDEEHIKKNKNEYDFAIELIKEMKEKNIAPTPENYNLYFYSKIEENEKFKNLKRNNLDFHFKFLEFEKKINELIKHNKVILGFVKGLNKFIKKEELDFDKKLESIKYSVDKVKVDRQIKMVKKELNAFLEAIEKSLKKIESNYIENINLIKNISSYISYDHKYDIHNYNYLCKEIKKEFEYNIKISSLVIFKIIFKNKIDKKNKEKIIKGISKIILNSLRKNDIVAFHKGKFFILLRNVDIQKAENIINRIEKVIKEAIFFINNKEFLVDVEYEIFELKDYDDFDVFSSFLK